MARDHRNFNQETPTQLKAQVKKLKNIPQQWAIYLKSRGLLPAENGDAESEVTISPK